MLCRPGLCRTRPLPYSAHACRPLGSPARLQVRSFKPDPEIYAAAEHLAQLSGPDLLFIDDREENAAAAAQRGWQAIHHSSPAATLHRLRQLGLPTVDL